MRFIGWTIVAIFALFAFAGIDPGGHGAKMQHAREVNAALAAYNCGAQGGLVLRDRVGEFTGCIGR
jgi:hypothetical protein